MATTTRPATIELLDNVIELPAVLTPGVVVSPTPTQAPTPVATEFRLATPFFVGPVTECGQILPILSVYRGPLVESLVPDLVALTALRTILPASARPALNRLLAAPETVGLAAYRAGQEAQGAYLNRDVPVPLASVVKVIHLIAYAEAAAAGRVNPTSTVTLDELNAYYQPGMDLGAHRDAIAGLEEDGRVFGDNPAVILDEVPGMMIESSSNAATDYLHMLLGQSTIEETAVALGLTRQTAPCPFLGQFLAMANHTRPQTSDRAAYQNYLSDPASYGRDVMLLTEAFSRDPEFRQAAIRWRWSTRRPDVATQRLFSAAFNAQGSARDYAALMARVAQNGLGSVESSFTARRFLEWPMRSENNQALFSNLGYKGGSLPGILTSVFYAYRHGETNPVVVALFFRGLDRRTYQQWRGNLAHIELARWLLYDPAAIPALRAILTPAT